MGFYDNRRTVEGNVKAKRVCSMIQMNLNSFLLYREHAPGIKRVRGEHGFYSDSHVQTTPGIASAMIWCTIAFNTKFASKKRRLFANCNDFMAGVRSCPEEPNYVYIAQGAYGNPQEESSSEIAEGIFKTLNGGYVE